MNHSEPTYSYNFHDEYLDLNLHLSYMIDDFDDLMKTIETKNG